MKFYMSYWSGGYLKKPEPYLINYHKLCAHYIIQNHGEVHLITDSNAKNVLKIFHTLQLPQSWILYLQI
jgi:hypothetical protein